METVYRLPPYKVRSVFNTLAEVEDWSVRMIGAPDAWKQTRGAYIDPDSGTKKKVKILVLDTGVQTDPVSGRANHPDLAGNLAQGRDFTGSPFGVGDKNGHGTATASLVMAQNDGRGIVGVASEAEVYIAKVLGDDGSGDNRGVAAAVDWGHELDVDVISFSGGSRDPDPTLERAIARFVEARAQRFFVAAAGNEGLPNSVNYPAAYPFVLAVGAVDRNGVTAPFSSRGPAVDIAAPGVGVRAAALVSRYAEFDGTSFACPLTAGVVALVVAKHRSRKTHKTPLKDINDLIGHLKAVATVVGGSVAPDEQGFGIVRADLMLAREDDEPVVAPKPSTFRLGPLEVSMPGKPGAPVSIDWARPIAAGEKELIAGGLVSLASMISQMEIVKSVQSQAPTVPPERIGAPIAL